MKTGIRRKIDDLGRLVIPAGIRRSLGIQEGDALEVHVEGERVVLTRPVDRCVFCSAGDGELRTFRGRPVCASCVAGVGAIRDELQARKQDLAGRPVQPTDASSPPSSSEPPPQSGADHGERPAQATTAW